MSMIAWLMRKHSLTRDPAEKRARKIYDARREAQSKKRTRYTKAQLTMQFDANDRSEEPLRRGDVDADLGF